MEMEDEELNSKKETSPPRKAKFQDKNSNECDSESENKKPRKQAEEVVGNQDNEELIQEGCDLENLPTQNNNIENPLNDTATEAVKELEIATSLEIENSPLSNDNLPSTSNSNEENIPSESKNDLSTNKNKRSGFKRFNFSSRSLQTYQDSGDEVAHDDTESDSESSSSTERSLTSTYFSSINSLSDSNSSDKLTAIQNTKTEILAKIKPKYSWSAVPELFNRQLGLTNKGQRSAASKNSAIFQYRLSGSLHYVERLELMYKLESHKGCVNSLNFNRSGTLLVSGSDDLKIILWKWASNEVMLKFDSGHISNVFQTKFMDLCNEINIVSSARDGQIRHHIVSNGGKIITNVLYKHSSGVHKIALSPNYPWEILSAGEDGHIMRCDLRDKNVEKIVSVKTSNNRKVPLYSIAANPIDNEFCVSGRDQFVRVYDKRYIKDTFKKLAPAHLLLKGSTSTLITSAVYNYLGTEILASYSDDDIFLFDNKNYTPGVYLHKYQGHNNNSTIKGVNFFGPRSEFILSGSDCSNCFFWDKNTEAIVQWMPGDETGVVNCLEPHPGFPMLATSGLDHDIKVWVPSCEKTPTLDGLNKCIQRNISSRRNANVLGLELYDTNTINVFLRHCLRNRNRFQSTIDSTDLDDDDDDDDNNDNDDDSDSDDEDKINQEDNDENDNINNVRALPCSPS